MRRIRVVFVIIFVALMGSSTELFAQCGGSMNGSFVSCCGTSVYLSDEWYPGGGERYRQGLVSCSYTVSGCDEWFVMTNGACLAASLSTPEMRRQLDQLSEQMPLLIASCSGGLVPYQPHYAEVSNHEKLILRSPKLDLRGTGE